MVKQNILALAVHQTADDDASFESSLDELISLCETAGGDVRNIVTQNRHTVHAAHYIGKGKIEDVQALIKENEIELIVANDELTPSQSRNLNDELAVPIIDRSQLILDIFAQRAKTKEGQLQVELAQLQYMLPRLRGQGALMSRLGAGIGTRGPGETKLETDQRHIRRKIHDIKRRLNSIVKQREQYRKRRKTKDMFQIAIVGYTNAGKSTLFNRITSSHTLEEDQLFATLDPLTREIRMPSGFRTLLTDTVGFIQDLPTTLIAAFRSTLEEVSEADFILHVVNSADPDLEQQQKTVQALLEDLNAQHIPTLTVYNKKDLLTEPFIPSYHPNILMSAYAPDDVKRMLEKVEHMLKDEWSMYHVSIPPQEGHVFNRLKLDSIIRSQYFDEEKQTYVVSGYIRNNHPLNGLLKEKSTND
ncbi:GTPase HflX [Lentibacillus saliphilus]|uniref:GTPase HflX n=1 Tax=Lentibacillus saliphilus TaxID=2737028 RepID=UPI001C305903|nr:GTPase HflX [Lentibacillus saliphilus]